MQRKHVAHAAKFLVEIETAQSVNLISALSSGMSSRIPFWPVCDVTQKAQSSMPNLVPVNKVTIKTFFEVYDLFKKVVYHRGVIIAAFTNCYHKSVFAR